MAATISPSVQDSLQTLDARMELNLLEVLAKSYGEGFVKAVEGLEAKDKPQVTKDDSRLLKEDVARMTKPIQDYNRALAGKVDEIVRDSFAAGKDDTEVARILRARIPEILNNEPITIQRPGKRPVSFTAEEYADLVSNVVPYAVRNEGYIRGLKEAGADGWQSVAVGDERMCPMCGEKHGQVYGWDDPKPPYHPKCRCRPIAFFRKRTKEEIAESERIKAKALEVPWDTSGLPADSAEDVAETLIDDIIPKKMAYPGSKIERPNLGANRAINPSESEIVSKYILKVQANENIIWTSPEGEDVALHDLAEEIGFAAPPTKVSRDELSKIISNGSHRELFRGVAKKEFADQFSDGAYFAGHGILGDGTYTAYGSKAVSTASNYSSKEGAIIRMAIDKDAKIITYSDLEKEMKDYFTAYNAAYKEEIKAYRYGSDELRRAKTKNSVITYFSQDPGRFAAFRGYDAIDIPGEEYLVVLNRKALYVQNEPITAKEVAILKDIEAHKSQLAEVTEAIGLNPLDDVLLEEKVVYLRKIASLKKQLGWDALATPIKNPAPVPKPTPKPPAEPFSIKATGKLTKEERSRLKGQKLKLNDYEIHRLEGGASIAVPKGEEGFVEDTIAQLKQLPEKLVQNNNIIAFSPTAAPKEAQLIKEMGYGAQSRITGTARPKDQIFVAWGKDGKLLPPELGTTAHELAHNFDKDQIISKSKVWSDAVEKDSEGFRYSKEDTQTVYVSRYAQDCGEGLSAHIFGTKFAEDFADAVKFYVTEKDWFKSAFAERAKVLEQLFGE